MMSNNFNPSGGSNHYHHYPMNHYNYFYNYPNVVNNINNRQQEYYQNPPRPIQGHPPGQAFPSTPAQNALLESQIFNPRAWPQNSFVDNPVPRRTLQQNSFSGEVPGSSSSVQRQTNQININNVSRNNGINLSSLGQITMSYAEGNNVVENHVTQSSSSVQRPTNQTDNANHNTRNLNNDGGRTSPANVQVNNGSAGNMFLHFNLDEAFSDKTKFIISDEEKASYTGRTESISKFEGTAFLYKFCRDVDMWSTLPSTENIMNTAKNALLVTHKFGNDFLMSLQGVINKRLQRIVGACQGYYVIKRMTLFYFVTLIVEAENVNSVLRIRGERACCRMLESLISLEDNFRNLVVEVSSYQKRQLYSLRCKWNSYVSEDILRHVDRNNFWQSQLGTDSISISNYPNESTLRQENQDKVSVSFFKDVIELENEDEHDVDDLGPFPKVIDRHLNLDWLLKFPNSENDKQRFTAKYSVENPTGKTSVFLYDKKVDFNLTGFEDSLGRLFLIVLDKDKMVDLAKEMFYIEKVFGTSKNKSVTDLLIARMSERNTGLTLLERWISVLLIHIVLSAEATQSSTKKQPKEDRPFCKAFSIEAFVINFREFVDCVKSKRSRQKLYWMRLIWNSCLLEESLSEIDKNNFWGEMGVRTSALPSKLILKRPTTIDELPGNGDEIAVVANINKNEHREEIATVELLSSEDECNNSEVFSNSEDSSIPIGDSLNNHIVKTEQNVPKRKRTRAERNSSRNQWFEEFQKSRRAWWARAVSTNAENIAIVKEKYRFQKDSGSVAAFKATELSSAMKMFQSTVLSIISTMSISDSKKLLLAAVEALFLAQELGEVAVHDITTFLDKGLQEGFDTKPVAVKLLSRLIIFLIIHIIIAFEEIEELSIFRLGNTKPFTFTFRHRDAIESAKTLSLAINDECMTQKLECLILMWQPYDADIFSSNIRTVFNSNEDVDAAFWKDIYDYTVENTKRLEWKMVRNTPITRKRNPEETQVTSNEKEGNASAAYTPETENVGDADDVNPISHDPENIGNISKRRAVTEKRKSDNTAENLQTVLIPDKTNSVPSTSNATSVKSTEASTENEGQHQYKSPISSSAATFSELLGINGRKRLLECYEKHKKAKKANNSVPTSSSETQIIENVNEDC